MILMAEIPGLEKTEETSAKRLAGRSTTLDPYFQAPHLDPANPTQTMKPTTKHVCIVKTTQQE